METSSAYQSYLSAMQNYQTPQGRKEYQAPYANQFEAIYDKAKNEDIKLSNAKDFLNNLSQSELTTLQKYSGLADSIDINSLSSEGAYNLLMHDNEQYDFNSDGVAEVGIAKKGLPVPINMPSDVRDAYINAMNSMSDKEKMLTMLLTLDPARLNATINNKPYTPTKMDYNYLKTQVENHLNPTNGAYTSPEAKKAYAAFWDAFNAAYTGDKTQSAAEETDSEVAKFLKDLREKGALKFLADLNQEKINKMVEEYKQKLLKEMGNSPEAMQKIEKLVEDFKKKLIEEMREKTEEEAKHKGKTTPISSNSFVQQLIDLQQKTETKPLEELLKA